MLVSTRFLFPQSEVRDDGYAVLEIRDCASMALSGMVG